jgi:predicted nucleic acid-binding protein
VRAVIADTGPIHYLVLIGHSEILPALFEKVIIPSVVRDELARMEAPDVVRNWILAAPAWLDVQAHPGSPFDDPSLDGLDDGEKAALALAGSLAADLVLMDDRDGVRVARNKGFRVIGTLRVLDLGERRGLLDLADAFERIKRTNFRYRQEVMDELLDQRKG